MDTIFKELRFMGNEDLIFNILDMQKKHIQDMPYGDKRDVLWRKFLSNVDYVEMKFEAELYSLIEDELDGRLRKQKILIRKYGSLQQVLKIF